MPDVKKYDIIIAGAGMSGLSLAWYLAKGGYKGKVLLTDKSFAPHNTKTWCFWTKDQPPFSEIIYRKWRKSYFSGLGFDSYLYMNEHCYYCIRGNDFKEYVLSELRNHKNFTLLEESILDFSSNKSKAVLVTKDSHTYLADYIFQSIFSPSEQISYSIKYPLIQHFLGYEIKTNSPKFDAETFTIMDVDTSFKKGFAFMYVLPFRDNKALVEFTVFSPEPMKKKKYKKKIRKFLKKKLGLEKEDYKIIRKEYGEIPMNDQPAIPFYSSEKVINLGTMAGLTKPSTGYTFKRVQDFSKQLAESLIQTGKPESSAPSKFRYRYYDLLLLHILANSTEDSQRVFRDLFKNNSLDLLFDFLSEDTNFGQDLKVMSSVPYAPFLKAISKNLIP